MNQSNLTMHTEGRHQILDTYFKQVEAIILARQHPISGLLPASTAITVHGDYTDAWVRDNVYSILAVWGLALAYRRQPGDHEGRTYRLEQSVVKLMRGLLTAMMKQSAKVERFKHTLDPLDALHAKFDTGSGEPVVGDDQWGHLQLDATALFCLMLGQMTASGLRIVFTPDEVDFVQNLVHYLGQAYHTPDYGIWERGHKMNEGQAELNASSLGMAKAALEALAGLDLYAGQGGAGSVIHVAADDIARTRDTLVSLLPRESESKETDAALLSVIGFPAFAVEDEALVILTRREIVGKLQGRYGCKRFLRDGHQTVVEDHERLHYEEGELAAFAHIESEWPLFFTYLLLDGLLRGDEAQAADYRARLESLFVERDGQRLLPELYYVPEEALAAERDAPGSQQRLPNDNLPLVWAQSLYILGALLGDGLLQPGDIDPLGRRFRPGRRLDPWIQVAVLAEDPTVQERLAAEGIQAQTLTQVAPIQVRQATQLTDALSQLGANAALGLSGRPPRQTGGLATSQVFQSRDGQCCVFLPACLKPRDFYLSLDNRLLVAELEAELAYIQRHWDQRGEPLLTLLITSPMLEADGHGALLSLLADLQDGGRQGVAVRTGTLDELLPEVGRARMELLAELEFSAPPLAGPPKASLDLRWNNPGRVPPITAEAWRREADNEVLKQQLAASRNPYAQMELLELLWERLGPDADSGCGGTIRVVVEAVFQRARRGRFWALIRRAAGLLEMVDDGLEDAVAAIVTRQHQLSVSRAYESESIIVRPLSGAEILARINADGETGPRERALLQEIVLFLGMLCKSDPGRFQGTLTLRVWRLLLLLTGQLARELELAEGEAFQRLLELSPHEVLVRLDRATAGDTEQALARLESLHRGAYTLGLSPVRFSAADDPGGVRDWRGWREANGVLTRLPGDFHPRVWEWLSYCSGVVIGDRLDPRNRLDSATLLADTTPAEKGFALRVEHLLNQIDAPEYRQLSIEALMALSALARANPELRVAGDVVLDVLIGTAVYLNWRADNPDVDGRQYNEHCADAWWEFYACPPHRVANAVMDALHRLLTAGHLQETSVAA